MRLLYCRDFSEDAHPAACQMEAGGIVRRIVHHQVPPKVEYCLTKWGQALCPALDALLKWAALREKMSDSADRPRVEPGAGDQR